MKNLLRLSVCLCIVLSILSCSKDSEAISTEPKTIPVVSAEEQLRNNLIGKWQYEKWDNINDGTELLTNYPHQCTTQKDNFVLGVDNSYNPNDFNAACVESALGNNVFLVKIINDNKIVNLAGFDNTIVSISSIELKLSNVSSGTIYLLKKI